MCSSSRFCPRRFRPFFPRCRTTDSSVIWKYRALFCFARFPRFTAQPPLNQPPDLTAEEQSHREIPVPSSQIEERLAVVVLSSAVRGNAAAGVTAKSSWGTDACLESWDGSTSQKPCSSKRKRSKKGNFALAMCCTLLSLNRRFLRLSERFAGNCVYSYGGRVCVECTAVYIGDFRISFCLRFQVPLSFNYSRSLSKPFVGCRWSLDFYHLRNKFPLSRVAIQCLASRKLKRDIEDAHRRGSSVATHE